MDTDNNMWNDLGRREGGDGWRWGNGEKVGLTVTA